MVLCEESLGSLSVCQRDVVTPSQAELLAWSLSEEHGPTFRTRGMVTSRTVKVLQKRGQEISGPRISTPQNMAPKLKIALIQFQPRPLSPEVNFTRAVSEIRSAASQGCHLAILPEFHLTSWAPDDSGFVASCKDSTLYVSRYQALARELDIHIVPGTIIEPVEHAQPNESGASIEVEVTGPVIELRNFAFFIAASTGEILSTYQKKNLWHEERSILTAGLHTSHQAFDVNLPGDSATIRVGLLICWDLAFPEPFRELVMDGAQLIIVPSYWHITKIDPNVFALNRMSEATFLDCTVVARAYENTCAVALCNAWGESQVAMPILGSLGKIEVEKEELIISEVDLDILHLAERYYKVRADLEGEGWHYSRVITLPQK